MHACIQKTRAGKTLAAKQKRETSVLKATFQNLIAKIRKDERGQDMVEYALLAAFIAVAAGATLPGIEDQISIVFSKLASVVTVASTT